MKKPKLTRAEQLARHRRIFLLARERDVTLAEAEQLFARQEWEEAQARLKQVRACGRRQGKSHFARFAKAHADMFAEPRRVPVDPWWLRD